MRNVGRASLFLVVTLCLIAVAACGSDSDSGGASTSTTTASKVSGKVTVSAAASLNDAFTQIGKDFHEANPDASATFNFGSSSTLATQILQGAPADNFASADQANMEKLTDKSLVNGDPIVFAKNQLVIVTRPGNPKHVKTLADLADAGTIALCGADVPCGKYAGQALQNAGVTIPESSVTRGVDVKATLASVTTGDANAAIVYATDAKSAGSDVETVEIPLEQNVIATYPIAVLTGSHDKEAAQAFVDYVMSSAGQATLQSFGFLPPS